MKEILSAALSPETTFAKALRDSFYASLASFMAVLATAFETGGEIETALKTALASAFSMFFITFSARLARPVKRETNVF